MAPTRIMARTGGSSASEEENEGGPSESLLSNSAGQSSEEEVSEGGDSDSDAEQVQDDRRSSNRHEDDEEEGWVLPGGDESPRSGRSNKKAVGFGDDEDMFAKDEGARTTITQDDVERRERAWAEGRDPGRDGTKRRGRSADPPGMPIPQPKRGRQTHQRARGAGTPRAQVAQGVKIAYCHEFNSHRSLDRKVTLG